MVKKAAELIILRNEFYASSYNEIKRVVSILLLIFILLLGFYIYLNRSIALAPKYIPTTPDGRLIISPPLSENHLLLGKQKLDDNGVIADMPPPTQTYTQLAPLGENALVLYWARVAIEDMFDYDYVHYRSIIEYARRYFTAQGHENFIQALLDSRNLETVKARSAVVIPEVTGPVKLIGTHTYYKNNFAWDIELPLKLTYQSASNSDPIVQTLLAKMSITRVSTLTTPFYGLAIYKLNFEQSFDQTATTAAPATTATTAAPAPVTAAPVVPAPVVPAAITPAPAAPVVPAAVTPASAAPTAAPATPAPVTNTQVKQ